MAYQPNSWDNYADGIEAFTCTKLLPNASNPNDPIPAAVPQLFCTSLKINMLLCLIFLIPVVLQIMRFYKTSGNRSRHRIFYELLAITIFSLLCYSVFYVIQLFNIHFELVQLMFWDSLNYFLVKVKQIRDDTFAQICRLVIWTYPPLLFAYFLYFLFHNTNPYPYLCINVIDGATFAFKIIMIGSLFLFYVIIGYVMNYLLNQDDDDLFDPFSREKRKKIHFKLKILLGLVTFAQFIQLFLLILHYIFIPDDCNLTNLDNGGIIDNTIQTFYSVFTLYTPLVGIAALFKLSSDELETKYFVDEPDIHKPPLGLSLVRPMAQVDESTSEI